MAFKPFTPLPFSRDEALCDWMRMFIRKFGGQFLRVKFEAEGGTFKNVPNRAGDAIVTATIDPTSVRVNILTDRSGGVKNGVQFTAPSVVALADAINIEAPKFNKRTVRQ